MKKPPPARPQSDAARKSFKDRWNSLAGAAGRSPLASLPLALVFLYAAWSKIAEPAAFAATIGNYRLLPPWALAPLALFLPWLELWAALLLFFNRWRRPAALVLALLLAVFMLAVGFNLARGLDFECGCFGPGGRSAGLKLLLQDGLLLLLAGLVLAGKTEEEVTGPPTRADIGRSGHER